MPYLIKYSRNQQEQGLLLTADRILSTLASPRFTAQPVDFSQNCSLCSILLERQATTGFQNLTARDWSTFSKSCIFIRQNNRTFYWSIIITPTCYWLVYCVIVIE